MSTITVGYNFWFEKNNLYSDIDPSHNGEWLNLLNYDIEKLDTWKNSNSNFKKCPAFVNYIDQFWVLKSSIDVSVKWEPAKKKFISNLSLEAHQLLIKEHHGDFNPYTGIPIFALNNCVLLFSDEDVWVDVLPPFNHIVPEWRLLPASFNICNWQRPIVPTFELLGSETNFFRGQPLLYLRFRSKNPRDFFKLKKQELDENIKKLTMSCSSLKFFQKNLSWQIVTGMIPNKFRPKKLLK